jgi:hypothetical protein
MNDPGTVAQYVLAQATGGAPASFNRKERLWHEAIVAASLDEKPS